MARNYRATIQFEAADNEDGLTRAEALVAWAHGGPCPRGVIVDVTAEQSCWRSILLPKHDENPHESAL